jgi:hypothetical protein
MTDPTTSEQWALDIILDCRKKEIAEPLKNHSADEVKRILAARRRVLDPTTRRTTTLLDGREVEAEAEQRGSLVRLRARLCRDGWVTTAFTVTAGLVELLTHREFLPAEFRDDPRVQAAVFDPIEEIWSHRLRCLILPR